MSNSAINTQVAQLKIGNVQNQADNSAVYSGGIWSLKNSTALTSVTITDSGNVGIGTASPSTKLHVLSASDDIARFSATAPYLSFFNGATRIGYIRCTSGGALLLNAESANSTMTFYTGDNERMRIDASGNVGIGTSSPAAKLDVTDAGGSVRIGNLAIESPSASGLTFNASNGVGNLLFRAAGAERMRIDASGNLLVGTTSPFTSSNTIGVSSNKPVLTLANSSLADSTSALQVVKTGSTASTAQRYISFLYNGGGNGNGAIAGNGDSQATFITFSDARLKENIINLPSQLANICALRPVEFDYKETKGHQVGFIAQEVKEIYPDLVSEDDNGYLMVAGLDKNMARLIKAIQELSAKNEALEARLAALESKP